MKSELDPQIFIWLAVTALIAFGLGTSVGVTAASAIGLGLLLVTVVLGTAGIRDRAAIAPSPPPVQAEPPPLLSEAIAEQTRLPPDGDAVAALAQALQQAQAALNHTQDQLQQIQSFKTWIDGELAIGRHIQMNMLTLTLPAFPKHKNLDLSAVLKPAREVSGDFYDFYFFRGNMSYLFEANRLCFCVGDVSGKGIPAALFMAVIKILLQSQSNECLSPAKILTHVNQGISADNPWCMFVTLFFGILNLTDGELVYTNAGHNPPYLRRRDGSLEKLNQRHGPPLGVVERLVYQESRTTLQTNDLLIVYTDGVTEAMDAENNLFSEQRLETVLQSQPFTSAEAVIHATTESVSQFQGDAEQSDDLTLLTLLFRGQPTVDPDDLLEFAVNKASLLKLRNVGS